MNLTAQMADHFRQLYFGGNWTCSNMKDNLADVTWQQAVTKVDSFNTIATLVYHINYYVSVQLRVLQGGELNAKDTSSFEHPPIQSEDDWQKMLDKSWDRARKLADLIEQLPENKLWEVFIDKKYGNYYRNIHGMIEHAHYHLGQIVLIKKLLQREKENKGKLTA